MWDQLRALLIGIHLVAVVAMAIPAPVEVNRVDVDDPQVIEGMTPLHETATTMGYRGDARTFRVALFGLGKAIIAVRTAALQPFVPYYKYAGTKQSWRMFGSVPTKPARVEIRIDHGDGEVVPLFYARHPEHRWRAQQFDQERFRAFMNDFSWRRDKRAWRFFGDWVARQAAVDFPEATRIHLRVRYRPVPRPDELRRVGHIADGETFWGASRDLADFR